MEFEWDEAKRLKNIDKHGIGFRDAPLVFAAKTLIVPSMNSAEERFLAIGLLEGRAVTIVYTLRGDVHRIISFRRARHEERERYQAVLG